MTKATPRSDTRVVIKQFLRDHPGIALLIVIILIAIVGYVVLRYLGYV